MSDFSSDRFDVVFHGNSYGLFIGSLSLLFSASHFTESRIDSSIGRAMYPSSCSAFFDDVTELLVSVYTEYFVKSGFDFLSL